MGMTSSCHNIRRVMLVLKRPKPGDEDRNPRVTDGGVNGKMAREDSTGDFSFKKWDVGREMETS